MSPCYPCERPAWSSQTQALALNQTWNWTLWAFGGKELADGISLSLSSSLSFLPFLLNKNKKSILCLLCWLLWVVNEAICFPSYLSSLACLHFQPSLNTNGHPGLQIFTVFCTQKFSIWAANLYHRSSFWKLQCPCHWYRPFQWESPKMGLCLEWFSSSNCCQVPSELKFGVSL